MKKILLAYDGTEPSRRALDQAAELARVLPASITVVSVVPARPGPVPLDPWDDRDTHDAELREARALLAEQGVEAQLVEPTGDPARTIETIAEKGAFDMVVVGSRGLSAVGRALEGSVSEHVATHAHQTVVVVH